MDVILLEDLEGVGSKGATVHVKPGYARNYLLPRKLALGREPHVVCAVLLLAVASGARPADAAAKRRPALHATAKRAPAAVDSNQVLVQIGRDAITRSDVLKRIESLPDQFRSNYSTPEAR